MAVYGYCRVSTSTQRIERQESNIKEKFPEAVIYKEAFTGTKLQGRKELDKILRKVNPGDTIVFDEVSRMSRNAEEGFALYKELFYKNINLIFLKELHINTTTYRDSLSNGLALTGNDIADIYIDATNRVLMILAEKQIKYAFEQAQKEVDYLHTRTREGMQKAKEAGHIAGRRTGSRIETRKAMSAKETILKHNKSPGGWQESRRSVFINTRRKSWMDAVQEKPTIKGKYVAITGILAFYKRQDALDQIEACGGYSQNNVTQNTDYLVVGYYRPNSIHGEKSNKTRLAEKYIRQGKKITIIKEDEFLGMLWQTP